MNSIQQHTLGVVTEWPKVLTAVPWPLMVWSTLALGTYQLRFVSWVFHVIFSFVHFISLYTLGGLRAFRKPLPYNMYLLNLRIANHILIKIFYFTWTVFNYGPVMRWILVFIGLMQEYRGEDEYCCWRPIRPRKINIVVLIRKKLKNDQGELKYHIIRKINAFHVFPKTEYLMRSVAFFFGCKN